MYWKMIVKKEDQIGAHLWNMASAKNVTREKREGVQFFAESGIVIQYIKDIVTDIQKEELMVTQLDWCPLVEIIDE